MDYLDLHFLALDFLLQRLIEVQQQEVDVPDADAFRERAYERVTAHHFSVRSLVEDVFWLWNEKLDPLKAAEISESLPEVLKPLWPRAI